MQDKGRCAAVVLAAGGSSRLGQPKQLLRLNGESLIARTVRLAREAGFAPVYVVAGADADAVRAAVGAGATVVMNPDWREGMGSSLRCGLRAAMAEHAKHVLLLVCDQPGLTAELLRRMWQLQMAERGTVTAARYAGRLGVPALFAESCYPELLAITGDRGAREVLERHAESAIAVEFEDGTLDIDRPEDLEAWQRREAMRDIRS